MGKGRPHFTSHLERRRGEGEGRGQEQRNFRKLVRPELGSALSREKSVGCLKLVQRAAVTYH